MSQIESQDTVETRLSPRFALPPMYTLVRVKLDGEDRFLRSGHAYDISNSGMRFELDEPLPPGTRVTVKAMLPGPAPVCFTATGAIVRLHDDSPEPGPARMAICFETFGPITDQTKLNQYLSQTAIRAA